MSQVKPNLVRNGPKGQKRPPLVHRPYRDPRSRYAADGLTIDWFAQQPQEPEKHKWPYPLPEWWTANIDGTNGISYCILNAKNRERIEAFKRQIAKLVIGHPYEILEFEEDLTPPQLFPYCRYRWLMLVDDSDRIESSPDYTPKVSIIMGTFRRQHIIGRTVASLLAQEYQNWELIVINNEKNGAVNLPADSRIRVHEHTEMANPCYAKNCGYQYVTGDLVCCFDDDNDMLPGYLSKMVAPFADPEVKIVHCGMRLDSNICDFSYDTQEAWLRKEDATPTWVPGSMVHDQIYYRGIIKAKGWTRRNIIQLGEVLIQAHTDPKGGMREGGC